MAKRLLIVFLVLFIFSYVFVISTKEHIASANQYQDIVNTK